MPINSFDNYPMSWKPDVSGISGPKYIALAKLLETDIRSGKLKAGTKLPPQRNIFGTGYSAYIGFPAHGVIVK